MPELHLLAAGRAQHTWDFHGAPHFRSPKLWWMGKVPGSRIYRPFDVVERPLFSIVELELPVVELPRAGLPSELVREESLEPVRLEPKPLPLEREDSTAPLDDSTALGADWTALPREVPLLPREPWPNAAPDIVRTNVAIVVIVLIGFIRLDLL
jgi:hypothetical protein